MSDLPKTTSPVTPVTVRGEEIIHCTDELMTIQNITRSMIQATVKQKNVSMEIKTGLYKIEEMVEKMIFQKKATIEAAQGRKQSYKHLRRS